MAKTYINILKLGVSPLLLLAVAKPALAQSTGTQALESSVETVLVSADMLGGGIMKPMTVAKERSTITQEYLNTQMAGQSVFDSLNKIPGVNFTNNDPFGNSGGNIRVHGFDGAHVAFSWDGMPLNDTGNYATYTNQVADSELIASATVNQGTTDVDSPTAAATGGVVAITTVRPDETYGAMADVSYGSNNYKRVFLRLDSGSFGPWGTTAFVSGSYTIYDKFKGPGFLEKRQFNAGLFQDLGDLGWVSLYAHFNMNRNNFYNNPTFYPTATGLAISPPVLTLDPNGNYVTVDPNNPLGTNLDWDEAPTCTRVPGGAGAQNDALCSSYYRVRINPSDTGNIRMASLFHLTPDLALAFDPSLQYVLANGGGYTALKENDPRLTGATASGGVDLNKDGDLLDTVGVYSPNNTNTIRYGLNTSLIWRLDATNTFQLAYTLDYGLHRQTGQYAYFDPNGAPFDPFGGYSDATHRVLSADNVPIRGRDRRSRAILNQIALAYEGDFLDDVLHVSAGVRAPFMERDLNNLCYEQVTGSGAGFPTCTSAAPTSALAANNTVTLPGSTTNLYVPPAMQVVKYNRVLPNFGITVSPWGPVSMFYADFAAGLAAPRTDNLYNGGNNGKCVVGGVSAPNAPGCVYSSFSKVQPETSVNFDIGYRYTTDMVQASISAYNTQFKNRIVTSFDQDQGISIDRNIGSVNVDGVDAEANIIFLPEFSLYNSISYEHSRVSSSPFSTIHLNSGGPGIDLAGNEVVETPRWTVAQRYQYQDENWTLGIGGKFVGSRFATDANDLKVPSYVTVDTDVTYRLDQLGWKDAYLKLNVYNLLNERYLGSISSKPCIRPDLPSSSGCGSYPSFSVGAPRAFQMTLRATY